MAQYSLRPAGLRTGPIAGGPPWMSWPRSAPPRSAGPACGRSPGRPLRMHRDRGDAGPPARASISPGGAHVPCVNCPAGLTTARQSGSSYRISRGAITASHRFVARGPAIRHRVDPGGAAPASRPPDPVSWSRSTARAIAAGRPGRPVSVRRRLSHARPAGGRRAVRRRAARSHARAACHPVLEPGDRARRVPAHADMPGCPGTGPLP